MSESKTTISGASSYVELGEYWDQHDLTDHWEQTKAVEFEVVVHGSSVYFPLERTLADQLRSAA